jgi:SAM-dependent methyltransferase
MPRCLDCTMRSGDRCTAHALAQQALRRPLEPPPLGACMLPIVEGYLALIQPGMRVLEVGCGSWDRVRRHCAQVGAHYEGIDTEAAYFGVQSGATRLENLAALSFADDCFDRVIGTQTMEHWAEHGCTLDWGLYQCFRVCRPGGQVLLNVPIHFHGTRPFMLGDLGALRRKLAPFSAQVLLEKWGSPADPLPPHYAHPGYARLRHRPAYVLDIRAVKDRPLPRGYSNRWGMSGRVSQVFNYPLGYNVHRVLRRLRGGAAAPAGTAPALSARAAR